MKFTGIYLVCGVKMELTKEEASDIVMNRNIKWKLVDTDEDFRLGDHGRVYRVIYKEKNSGKYYRFTYAIKESGDCFFYNECSVTKMIKPTKVTKRRRWIIEWEMAFD